MLNVFFDTQYCETEQGFDTFVKARHVASLLDAQPVRGARLTMPAPASAGDLALVHDEHYIEAVQTGEPSSLAKSNGVGWDPLVFNAASWSTGGAVSAALDALATGGIAGSLSSGLHHAYADRGYGYCTFNGLALAAVRARQEGAERVLILDLDAHCGGGTASIISGRRGIEQVDVSVVTFDWYAPTAEAGQKMSTASSYLADVASELDDVRDPGGVSLLLYNAGMDPHERSDGPLGITTAVLRRREEMVFEWARSHSMPVAFVLAGGYVGRGLEWPELAGLHRMTVEVAALHATG